jgi:hypothetical protein
LYNTTVGWDEDTIMGDMTFEQVLESARQLSTAERALLVEELQETLLPEPDDGITIEQLDAELAQLRAAGAFEHVESLRGKFARPGVDLSEEELNISIREIRDQWKEDMVELDTE